MMKQIISICLIGVLCVSTVCAAPIDSGDDVNGFVLLSTFAGKDKASVREQAVIAPQALTSKKRPTSVLDEEKLTHESTKEVVASATTNATEQAAAAATTTTAKNTVATNSTTTTTTATSASQQARDVATAAAAKSNATRPDRLKNRDFIRTLIRISEQTYPDATHSVVQEPWMIGNRSPESEYRKVTSEKASLKVTSANFSLTEDFFRGVEGAKEEDNIGVHAGLYYNRKEKLYVLSFQGSFSTDLLLKDLAWWKKYGFYDHAEVSEQRWAQLGNDLSSLNSDRHSPVQQLHDEKNYALLSGGLWMRLRENNKKLDEAIPELTESQLHDEGYFAIAKIIANTVLNYKMEAGTSLVLTGHSLGGSLAALVSMYLQKSRGVVYETVTFGAPGVSCLGQQNFPGEVVSSKNVTHPAIVNYVDDYDWIGMFDQQPGHTCRISTSNVGKEYCKKVMGFGITATVDKSLKDSVKACSYYTHSVYHILETLADDSVLLSDGSTALGCTNPVQPVCADYSDLEALTRRKWIVAVTAMVVGSLFVIALVVGCFRRFVLGRRFWCDCCCGCLHSCCACLDPNKSSYDQGKYEEVYEEVDSGDYPDNEWALSEDEKAAHASYNSPASSYNSPSVQGGGAGGGGGGAAPSPLGRQQPPPVTRSPQPSAGRGRSPQQQPANSQYGNNLNYQAQPQRLQGPVAPSPNVRSAHPYAVQPVSSGRGRRPPPMSRGLG